MDILLFTELEEQDCQMNSVEEQDMLGCVINFIPTNTIKQDAMLFAFSWKNVNAMKNMNAMKGYKK